MCMPIINREDRTEKQTLMQYNYIISYIVEYGGPVPSYATETSVLATSALRF